MLLANVRFEEVAVKSLLGRISFSIYSEKLKNDLVGQEHSSVLRVLA